MTNHKATDEQWDELERFAGHGSTVACVLELRARVMALESQSNHIGDINKMVPPPMATDEELRKVYNNPTYNHLVGLRAIYDLGVAHGQAGIQEVAEPAPVARGLVARVIYAICRSNPAGIDWYPEARAAILEVARWLREQGTPASGWAMRLEQEAGR